MTDQPKPDTQTDSNAAPECPIRRAAVVLGKPEAKAADPKKNGGFGLHIDNRAKK